MQAIYEIDALCQDEHCRCLVKVIKENVWQKHNYNFVTIYIIDTFPLKYFLSV